MSAENVSPSLLEHAENVKSQLLSEDLEWVFSDPINATREKYEQELKLRD
jgi:hypothetical protein